jgi:hypothetical protein
VATGLGAVFGFQSWKLAEYGFAASIPCHGSLWIFLSHVMLGLSVGATAGFTSWWRRGWVLGLFFSIPAVLGTHAPAPYGVAMTVSGLVTGLLAAFLTDTLVPDISPSTGHRSPALRRSSEPESPHEGECQWNTTRQRLAEEKACLEDLDAERKRRRDSRFGRTTEDRVVWSELLELELQEIDEQLSRIRSAAGDVAGSPREHSWIGKNLYKRRPS